MADNQSTEQLTADICVIGAGSGGLSVAAGTSQLGLKTILIEKGKMGGDCLNYGCVPSKALLAAGHSAHHHRQGTEFGITAHEPDIDFLKAQQHVKNVIATIEPHDSVERFESMGVHVIQGAAKFIDHKTVSVNNQTIKARRYIIATGSSPLSPPISGLDEVQYLTNETIFDLQDHPEHLIIIGGGPIGLEMAQAHHRLGVKVTVIANGFMEQDDPELSQYVIDQLRSEGITMIDQVMISSVRQHGDRYDIHYQHNDDQVTLSGSHLLVATGRKANVENLGLDSAHIEYTARGIKVGAHLRTSNKSVYAIGDVTGGLQFTHKAGYDAGIIIRRLAFGMFWAKADYSAIPWVTYTDPELANVGLTESQARERYGNKIKVLKWSYKDNDRAQAEAVTKGLIKVVTNHKGRILGTAIVGKSAGELIQPWCLALTHRFKISQMTSYIAPYPTLGEINKRVAGSYFTSSLFSDKTRKLVKWLSKLG